MGAGRLFPIWASNADPEMLLTLKAIQEPRSNLFPIPPCGEKCLHIVVCAQAKGYCDQDVSVNLRSSTLKFDPF